MSMTHRRFRELALALLIRQSSMHHVIHALVEICHDNVRQARAQDQTHMDRWQAVCHALTVAEDRARHLGL